jgi:hypothetical protein
MPQDPLTFKNLSTNTLRSHHFRELRCHWILLKSQSLLFILSYISFKKKITILIEIVLCAIVPVIIDSTKKQVWFLPLWSLKAIPYHYLGLKYTFSLYILLLVFGDHFVCWKNFSCLLANFFLPWTTGFILSCLFFPYFFKYDGKVPQSILRTFHNS